MNKYFLSQIVYDRFKLYSDNKKISMAMDKLRKRIMDDKISQEGLIRVLERNVNFSKKGV